MAVTLTMLTSLSVYGIADTILNDIRSCILSKECTLRSESIERP